MCRPLAGFAMLLFLAGSAAAAAPDLQPVTVKPAAEHAPVPLVANGVALATICVMDVPAIREIDVAIRELRACIEAATGVKLLESRGKLVDGPAIVIGGCPEAVAAGLDGKALPVEGFAIKTAPNRVFIVGHDDERLNSPGTAWGIAEFLERFIDARYYWPPQSGGRSVPKAAALSAPPTWIEDAPAFRRRGMGPIFGDGGPNGELVTIFAMLRDGDSWPTSIVVHAPSRWGELYGKEHPQVMQKRKDGSRDPQMLCYGNPRTLALHMEVLARAFDKGEKLAPGDLGIVDDAVTVSPWDAGIACHCDDCRKLMQPERGGYGEASQLVGTFVATLARALKDRWPGKGVFYLPYVNYTLAPQGIEFPDNVAVQLCGMPGLANYKEPATWKEFQDNIDTWRGLVGGRVHTWDYNCWPEEKTKACYLYPHVVRDYYRTNRGRIVGTTVNGTNDHFPRSHLSLVAWLKCMWDPDFDVDAMLDEFAVRMFGPAAVPMRELVRMQCEGWEKSRWPGGVFSAKHIYTESFPKPVLDRMRDLLAEARRAIGTDLVLRQRLDYYEKPFAEFFREYEVVIEGKGVRPLVAKKVAENPTVDGKLDEPQWSTAAETTFRRHVKDGEDAEPGKPTWVKAVWTGDGVTFGFRCGEPNPDKLLMDNASRDDGGLWGQDCLEVFIEPSGSGSGKVAQLILSAGGGLYDAWDADTGWTCAGLSFAKALGPDFWSMEVFVPLAALPGARPPATGVSWLCQFTRCRSGNGKADGHREHSKMNAKYGGFNSNTADFAPLRFEE